MAVEILNFVEEAASEQYGVLVHSIRGQSRACCVMCIFLMNKFNWSLLKALEFINYRRPNLEIRASFLQQLSNWQQRRIKRGNPRCSETWDEVPEPFGSLIKNEEAILRNTYINAQLILQEDDKPIDIPSDSQDYGVSKRKDKKAIGWNVPPKEPG